MKLKKLASFTMFARNFSFIALLLFSTAVFCQITYPGAQINCEVTKSISLNQASIYHVEASFKAMRGVLEARVHYSNTADGPFQAKSMYSADNEHYACDIQLEQDYDALYYYIEARLHSDKYNNKQAFTTDHTFVTTVKQYKKKVATREFLEYGELKVFPNPAKENVWIAYSPSSYNNEYHQLTLIIYDLYGRTCLVKKLTTEETQFRLDISHLASGSYLIILHDEWGRFMSEKLVIQ